MTLDLNLEKFKGMPLHKQLTSALIEAVTTGRLKPGDVLPSSRKLAKHLSVSRCTVTNSYEELMSLGYIETSPCKSVCIARDLQIDFAPQQPACGGFAQTRVPNATHMGGA